MGYDEEEAALASLERQLIPDYSAIARKFNIGRITLMRRHKGITTSMAEARARTHQLLTKTQEEVLINQINKLTVRGLPPTTHIIKNLAEEIIRREVNKN
jgi:hypothetical protein